jgi:hypothetical protein
LTPRIRRLPEALGGGLFQIPLAVSIPAESFADSGRVLFSFFTGKKIRRIEKRKKEKK